MSIHSILQLGALRPTYHDDKVLHSRLEYEADLALQARHIVVEIIRDGAAVTAAVTE